MADKLPLKMMNNRDCGSGNYPPLTFIIAMLSYLCKQQSTLHLCKALVISITKLSLHNRSELTTEGSPVDDQREFCGYP